MCKRKINDYFEKNKNSNTFFRLRNIIVLEIFLTIPNSVKRSTKMYTIFPKNTQKHDEGRFRTSDLWAKSPTRYLCATSLFKIAQYNFCMNCLLWVREKTPKVNQIFPLLSIIIKNPFGQSGNVYNFSGKFSINFCIICVPFLRFWNLCVPKKGKLQVEGQT